MSLQSLGGGALPAHSAFHGLPASLSDLLPRSESDSCAFNALPCGSGCTEPLGTCCSATGSVACDAGETCVDIDGAWGCCPAGESCDWIKTCQDYVPGECTAGPKEACCPQTAPVCLEDGVCGIAAAATASVGVSVSEAVSSTVAATTTAETAAETTAETAASAESAPSFDTGSAAGAQATPSPDSVSTPDVQAPPPSESPAYDASTQVAGDPASSPGGSAPAEPSVLSVVTDEQAPPPVSAPAYVAPSSVVGVPASAEEEVPGYTSLSKTHAIVLPTPSSNLPPYPLIATNGSHINSYNATVNGTYGNFTTVPQFTGAAQSLSVKTTMILGLVALGAAMGTFA